MAKNDLITWLIYGLLGIGGIIVVAKALTGQKPSPVAAVPTGKPVDVDIHGSQWEHQPVTVDYIPSAFDRSIQMPASPKFDFTSVSNSLYGSTSSAPKKMGCGCNG